MTDNARLLDCGFCYEEQGEEVHPHPECPTGRPVGPARYRRTPADIEAVQWTGANTDVLRAFAGGDFDTIDPEDRIEDPDQDALLLVEASHWVGIKPGDWVVKYEGYFVAKADETFRAVWEPDDLPARLEAVLTERYTELGNPFSGMRRHEQGPDGWPASHSVGPRQVAEVLRELLAAPAAVPVPPPAEQTALRQRIAALHEPIAGDGGPYCQTCTQEEVQPQPVGWWMPWPCPTLRVIDEVLAVLPEQTDRAAVLHDAAIVYAEILGNTEDHSADPRYWQAIRDVIVGLRRMAAEEQPAKPHPCPHGCDTSICPCLACEADEEQPAPCAECGHPKAVHREGEDPVTPGECSACPDDDARHDHRPAVGEQPETQHLGRRANAEDCPACKGTNPPYPFLCPAEPGAAAETQETPVLCNYWTFTRTEHNPHRWEPQPGMDPVHCPGVGRDPE